MICPTCNTTVHRQDAMFCDNCGTSLTAMVCHICNTTDHRPGAKFCRHCGSPLEVLVCPQCHYMGHLPGSDFCDQCGSSLARISTKKGVEDSAETQDQESSLALDTTMADAPAGDDNYCYAFGHTVKVASCQHGILEITGLAGAYKIGEKQDAPHLEYDKAPQSVAAVDLGLPSGRLWASCNLGARKPEEYGAYYSWGETEEKYSYNEGQYIYFSFASEKATSLGKSISGTMHDVARLRWGTKWRMPTIMEFKELIDCCSHEWTTVNGIEGSKFTGPNGNSIFLPAAGYRSNSDLYDTDLYGYYWSGSQDPIHDYRACNLYFDSGRLLGDYRSCDNRDHGLTIRPVA